MTKKQNVNSIRTYISLFSSAGIGCYGFELNGFECVATNELLEPRIEVQKANHKCKYESGYICGDATSLDTHVRIYNEIKYWREHEGVIDIDVVFATPPCQGMSTVNYKKTDHEQKRNSLVVEAIKLIMGIHPKIFVFENVRAFMKSICTDISGQNIPIADSIYNNLSDEYYIYWKVINFKDYGVPSSRPRTIVIGTRKDLNVSPLLLFPTRQNEIPLKDSIGSFPRLAYCEKDATDPLHFARPFPSYMLEWIKDLKEGETAFDNPDEHKPYTIDAHGNRVINKGAYMGNKYRRLIWDRPGACIATRSDVMSSQDTIHPCDNRVLSIRELMTLMTIPNSFKWTKYDDELTVDNSEEYLKKHEGNIRRCIGEAVPTHIINEIASKINLILDYAEFAKSNLNLDSNNIFIKMSQKYGLLLYDHAFPYVDDLFEKLLVTTVKIVGIHDFFLFYPQIISFYSHVNNLVIDIYNISEEDRKEIIVFLSSFVQPSNLEIHLDDCYKPLSFYNILIENRKCFYLSSKKSVKKSIPNIEDKRQLTLF
jgi:DNA (cytosine-5)-methyltransferase 1